jgi:hypothetical protein
VAADELHTLEGIVAQVTLSDAADSRQSPLALPNGKLHTSLLYQLLAPSKLLMLRPKLSGTASRRPVCSSSGGW